MRERLRKNRIIYLLYLKIYRFFGKNRIRTGGAKSNNRIQIGEAKLKNCEIAINGKDNRVIIGFHTMLHDCSITISGDHCEVIIGQGNTLLHAELVCEDDRSAIRIGNRCIFAGPVHLAATEGKRIEIGDDFLCSNGVTIRTGDSHSIYDESGSRINNGKDVKIAEHVWIGNQVIILKGTEIGRDVVVGSGSVVSSGGFPANTIIAGNPGRIIRKDITWDFQR